MAKLQDKFFNKVIEGNLELDEAEKAQAVSDLQSADVKVKSLEVTNDSNLKGDIKLNGESAFEVINGTITLTSGLTIVASYCKVVRNFNELQFIFNCRVKNETENTLSITNDSSLCSFELPDTLLDKIYAHNGQSLKDVTGAVSIAYTTLYLSQAGGIADSQNPAYCNLYYRKDLNEIRMYLEGSPGLAIESNMTLDFESRISLAL